ncbi:MAG TPA: type I DNA topoisomerase [Syntrophomonadaceae bacterium]|nr:type I DNA topoisomerase [Syntrophomonadaceae bacterium]
MAGGTLVIVESAAKAKTLSKFLGRGYKVKASVGHVKDLPKSKLGIDIENNFQPQYITIRGKGELLKEIKEESLKVDRVLLATDPDREGEAIAWHLQNAMRIPEDSACRIEFHEITRDAVKNAIKHSRPVDRQRVQAQQARRVLDRLVGYNLSPLLWSKVRKGLSAGRVQSVAVRLIAEREDEINRFVPEEYWTLETVLTDKAGHAFMARIFSFQDDKLEITSQEQMTGICQILEKTPLKALRLEKKEKPKTAKPPFTTSTMQQEASRRLNFFSKRTMKVAQELYEGLDMGKQGTVGLISYLRTDSTRVATVAQEEARDFISKQYGNEYVPEKPNEYKSRKGAQDAHEAIRPTAVSRTPESVKAFLSRDQYRLYKLIWDRFVSSQMAPALYDTVRLDIKAGEYGLRANSSQLRFAGCKRVYNDGDDEEVKNPIPDIAKGQELFLQELKPEQHFTQPPPRFTEASLVKHLEEKNIGRPSTYAPIIDTILKRNYVERRTKQFVPTELGIIVVELLKDNFPRIMDVEFTAKMEEDLDRIEEGELEWTQVVSEFYEPFNAELEKAKIDVVRVEIKDEEAGKPCPKCDKPLLIKHGRFGKFLACSGFPECRHTESVNQEIGIPCPRCQGAIVALKSKKGRRFYGCSNFPTCEFRSWNKPTGELCSHCGEALVEKPNRSQEIENICPNPNCPSREKVRA